jgi:glycosyltransferase involved in cell wall biosynthesis
MTVGTANDMMLPEGKSVTSVVVPTYNSTATLPRALTSIDDTGSRIEILVVDDCSHDIAELRAIAGADSRVVLVEKPERTNAAHSRAIGLERAAGDLVLFLDSDDHFHAGHLARRRQLHRASQAGIVIGRFRLNDGMREWDGPMSDYLSGSMEDYLFANGGDARSSTVSVDKRYLRGTTFDPRLAKHQDWGFILAADRNGERIGFDPQVGVVIDIAHGTRMSGRSNVEASLAFAREHVRSTANRRRFLLGRLRTSLRLGDAAAAVQFRTALLALQPSPRERWGSAAMIAAGQIGIAAPLHRLLASRR